jgi:hypothetical protein
LRVTQLEYRLGGRNYALEKTREWNDVKKKKKKKKKKNWRFIL